MPNQRVLGLFVAALLLPTPLLAKTRDAQTYLRWCQDNVRDGATAKADEHCGLYAKAALSEGLGVWTRADVVAAVAQKHRLDAAKASTISKPAQQPAAGNVDATAGDKANTYLEWFQNNVRGSNPSRADQHWKFYTQYAGKAGLPLWRLSDVEAHAKRTFKKLSAFDAPNASPAPSKPAPAPSTPKTEAPAPAKPGVPEDWDEAWHDPSDLDGKADNGESTPYVKDLIAKMGSDLVGSGFQQGQGYLSQHYMGHDTPVQYPGRGLVYIRHTGTDFPKPIGTTVRALTPGVVVGTYNDAKTSNQALAVVKEDGADRWWVYLHTSYRVKQGQHVAKGTVIGTIADPRGEWNHPHVHVNVMTTWPLSRAVSQYLSLGRSYHPNRDEAVRLAKAYTMHPLEAYARANGLLP
ncbi:MAG: M23 family metallopeptidase [Geminicoccaceae bacterium]|nr:M23 family metallopeptidase [Geminicoccaceae bacterium]